MAKKKNSKSEDTESLIASVLSIVDKDKNKAMVPGIELRTFAERWIMDSNIIRLGEMYEFGGDPASGKSQYMQQVAAMFVRAGGAAEIIDTEFKSNPENSIIPNIGEDVYYSGRFGFSRASTINEKAGKGATEDEMSWMEVLEDRVAKIKSIPELADLPFFIGIDSLLGAPSMESKKRYEDNSGTVEGRTGDGMARASAITDFLANFAPKLANTNITVGFTNHGKTNIVMGFGAKYASKKKNLPGGDGPWFHCSTILYFSRGAAVHRANMGGRTIHIEVYKNSFGDDRRRLEVTFYFDMLKDAEGNIVYKDDGNPKRRLKWDWHEATANLLKKCLTSDNAKDKATSAKAVIPGFKVQGGYIYSKTLEIEKMSFPEFGRYIMENKEIYAKLMEIPKLTINHAPEHLVMKPDWEGAGFENENTGGWEEDTDTVPAVEELEDEEL